MKQHDYDDGGAIHEARCYHPEYDGDVVTWCLEPMESTVHTLHEHVILVAVNVLTYRDREHAERQLLGALTDLREKPGVDSWWIAEDARTDNSDAESAVFVPKGMGQAEAERMLRAWPTSAQNQADRLARYGNCQRCANGEHSPMEDERGRLKCRCCGWSLDEHGRERKS